MNERSECDVAIVGAGITGLATAWWLQKAGIDVLLIERDAVAGGTMKTERDDGWLIETGPNSALETTPLLRELVDDVGIGRELIYASEAAENRYILRDGFLHPLPMKPWPFLKSHLWTVSGKLRLLKEPFVGRASREETIAEFVTRRLGKEFLDYAINPFVAGVYAGDPEQLSVQSAFPKLYALEKNYGGLIRGQILGARERRRRAEKAKDRSRLFSFRSGMETLPAGIARALGGHLLTDATVMGIEPETRKSGSKRFRLTGRAKKRDFEISARTALLAVPSYSASALIEPLDVSLANSLKNVYYPPVAEVFLGFAEKEIRRPLDGFGFLIPAKERRNILGTIWSSVLFPGRAPEGHVALTTFVGGSRQPEIAALSDDELLDVVMKELASIMAIEGKPHYSRIIRWERAIPQYHLGHAGIIRKLEEFELRHPGLFVGGNFRGGIAVGDCIINSEVMTGRIRAFLAEQTTAVTS